MRKAVIGLGLVVAAAGLVWLLQGVNVLPGSFMTGDPFWARVGLACLLGGLGLSAVAWLRKPHP